MDLSELFGVISGVVFAVSATWYTWDVYKGKVVVSIATFFMFMIINISHLISLIIEGVWGVVPFTFVGLIASLLIFLISLKNKKIYFEFLDKIALAGALAGFAVWLLAQDAAMNIYILTVVNAITAVPLVLKSFKNPDMESMKPWLINLLASFFLILTINSTAPVVWAVPVRQFLFSVLLNLGLFIGFISKRNSQKLEPVND
jgi:hypothetical protein